MREVGSLPVAAIASRRAACYAQPMHCRLRRFCTDCIASLRLPTVALGCLGLLALAGCQRSSGDQCDEDRHCLYQERDVGKRCDDGYCVFPTAPRSTAPNFCLQVVNPTQSDFGSKHCLAQEKGKATMLFFGQWLS